jgi:hypothetical protein
LLVVENIKFAVSNAPGRYDVLPDGTQQSADAANRCRLAPMVGF